MGKKKLISFALTICMLLSLFMPQTAVYAADTEQDLEQTVIDVTQYGVDPSGAKDSMPGIMKAIEAAKKVDGPVTLNFPKGEYQIYPDKAYRRELYVSNTVGTNQSLKMKNIGFLFENMHDVTIEGNDSLFMFHGKMTTFATINSTNIKFQNFEFDFYTPSVVDITVESVSGDKAVIYVPECYDYSINGTTITWKCDASPYMGQPYWTATNALANAANQRCDLSTGLTVRNGTDLFDNLTGISELGNHRLEFSYNRNVSFKENVCYQMRYTTRDHPGMFFWKSTNVTMENIGVHFLYGFGIVVQSTEDITLRNVDFEARKGTGRTTAGFADFLQISGCKGEVLIEGCSFANAHDDPINIHGTFNQVVERIAPNKFKVRYMHHETAGFPNFFEGDEIEFMKIANMTAVEGSKAKVVEVKGPTGCSGASESGSGSLTDTIITLDRDIPDEVVANENRGQGYVVENITYTPSVTIRNNIFKETSTRGLLVTTRKKVLIQNNIFDGTNMASISISNDASDWYESGPVSDVTIEGNTFYRNNNTSTAYDNVNTQPAVINIVPTGTADGTNTVHKNIKITNNDFYILDGAIVQGKSTDGLQITNNRIYRYEPNVSVNLTGAAGAMRVGETANLAGTVTGNTYSREMYYLLGCKNVEISGNSYDDGLKLAAILRSTDADEVHLGEGENISLNGPGGVTAKQATLTYESSDKEVLKVTSGGKLTALKEGTAKVRACTVAAGRKFVSDWKEITVTSGGASGDMPTGITLTGGKDTSNTLGETIQYTAQLAPAGSNAAVTWSVIDAATQNATDCATITQTGALTTAANGVVEVVASTANGLEARKLLVINKGGKTTGLDIVNRDDANWSFTDEGNIQINAQPQGLYKEQTARNVFLYQPEGDMTKVEATVKLHGKTVTGYQEAGLIFYQGEDDYFSIERKHSGAANNANGKIKVTVEDDRTDAKVYEGNGVDDPGTEDIWFKLVKNGNTLSDLEAYYKTSESGTWIKREIPLDNGNISGKADLAMPLTNSFKIGFITGANTQVTERTPFVFSDLKVKIGDGQEQTIDLSYDNTAPVASDVRTVYNEETKALSAEYTFADADSNQGDTKGAEIVRYMVSDEQNGTYALTADMDPLAGKWVKAVVIPKDSNGLYGAPAVSETAVQIAEIASGDDASLPASESMLKSAAITGVSGFAAFDSSVRSYNAKASTGETGLTASFEAKDEKAAIEVFFNDMKCFPNGEGAESYKAENLAFRLASGFNTIKVKVTAEDKKSCSEYRWTILRKGNTEAVLKNITINNQQISGFTADKFAYEYTVSRGTEELKVAAETDSVNAIVDIWANNEIIEGKEAEVHLLPGWNTIVVRIRPETLDSQKLYSVRVFVASNRNANLESAEFGAAGITLEQEFNTAVSSYEGISTVAETSLTLNAEEENAKIEVFVNGKTKGTKTGTLTQTIPITAGNNKIQVKVTSEDGSAERIYTFDINGMSEVPLSDLEMQEGSSNGWNGHDILINQSVEGNPIRLLVNGETKEFTNGIGGHAPMTIIYDIEGKGFTSFSAYLGVDQEVSQAASITYEVYLDDEVVASSSGVMTFATEADLIELNEAAMTGKKTLKIVVDPGSSNSSDHVSLGDAVFTTAVQEPITRSYVITYYTDPKDGGKVTAASGSETTNNGFISVEENGSVTLTAEANPGYEFTGWYNERNRLESTEISLTLSEVTADAVYTAKFKVSVTDEDLENAVSEAEKKDLSRYDAVSVQEYQKALDAVKALIGTNATPAQIQAALDALAKAEEKLSLKGTEPDKDDPNALKLNSVFEENGYTYKITALNGKSGTVTVTAIKKEKTITILPEVKKNGYTFKVTEIGAGAYKGNKKKLKSVIIGANVIKIGSKAFFKCSKLKTICFQGTTVPKIEKNALKGIKKNCKVQYPKKMNAKQLKKLKKAMKKGGAGSKISFKKK